MRTYSEHQNLTNVLNFVKRPELDFDGDQLGNYLNEKTRFFNKKNEVIKNLILSYYSLISPGEITAIEGRLDNLRLQVKKKVWHHLDDASVRYATGSAALNDVEQAVGDLISKDKIKEGIEVLKSFAERSADKGLINSATGIEARYSQIQKAIIDDTIGYNERSIAQNKLRLSILTLASVIAEAVESD